MAELREVRTSWDPAAGIAALVEAPVAAVGLVLFASLFVPGFALLLIVVVPLLPLIALGACASRVRLTCPRCQQVVRAIRGETDACPVCDVRFVWKGGRCHVLLLLKASPSAAIGLQQLLANDKVLEGVTQLIAAAVVYGAYAHGLGQKD